MVASRPRDAAVRCVGYASEYRESTIALWNRVFRGMPNFIPFDRARWLARLENFVVPGEETTLSGAGPARFDPRLFRLALRDGDVVGFAHGGTWEDEFLARLLPDDQPARLGTLMVIGVCPDARRLGIGRALLRDLEETLKRTHRVEPPLRADGRGYNPFYGNFVAPLPPPFGTAEGIAIPTGHEGTRAFFREFGFGEEVEARTCSRDLADRPNFDGTVPEGVVIEEVENYQPILGSDDGSAFPVSNASRTWLLRAGDQQLGALVAFPLLEDLDHWAIHSFEVDPSRRGEGLGKLLLRYSLSALASRGARSIEALTVPSEGPEADKLYLRHGFEARNTWVVLR